MRMWHVGLNMPSNMHIKIDDLALSHTFGGFWHSAQLAWAATLTSNHIMFTKLLTHPHLSPLCSVSPLGLFTSPPPLTSLPLLLPLTDNLVSTKATMASASLATKVAIGVSEWLQPCPTKPPPTDRISPSTLWTAVRVCVYYS